MPDTPHATVPSAPSAPPRTRLIALGDELLAGVGDARALGWIGRAVASSQGTDCRLDLFPSALPGDTSGALAERWDGEVRARLDEAAQNDGSIEHRVVVALGRADAATGLSLARARLNLAKVLDGLERMRIPAFVVGPAPSRDPEHADAVRELSTAFADVCSRRRTPYVDMVSGLEGHEQWEGDLSSRGDGIPGQTGYGLMAWLVLHGGFSDWAAGRA